MAAVEPVLRGAQERKVLLQCSALSQGGEAGIPSTEPMSFRTLLIGHSPKCGPMTRDHRTSESPTGFSRTTSHPTKTAILGRLAIPPVSNPRPSSNRQNGLSRTSPRALDPPSGDQLAPCRCLGPSGLKLTAADSPTRLQERPRPQVRSPDCRARIYRLQRGIRSLTLCRSYHYQTNMFGRSIKQLTRT